MDIKLAGSWNNSPLPSIPSLPSLPPSTLKHPLHPMRDPNPHLLPTQPGTLATPCTPSQRSGCWGDPAFAQQLSSGGHSCVLMQVAWDARLACEAAAGAGSITAEGGAFPMALLWECFSCSQWEPDLGNSKSISAGSLGAATPWPHAGSPARCLCRAGTCRPRAAWVNGANEGQNGQTDPMGTQQGTTLGSLTHSPQTTGWHLLPQHAQGNSVLAVHGPSEAASTVSGEQCPPEVQEQLPVCSHMLHLLPPSPVPQCPKPGSPRGGS